MKRAIKPLAIVVVLGVLALVLGPRLVAWFTGNEATGGFGPAATITAGPWKVATSLSPDPPQVKNDHVRVAVTDASGSPVGGADVQITYDMPAMGAMAEMKSTFRAAPAGEGAYEATFDLPMGGSWGFEVSISANGTTATARYALTIGSKGLTIMGGAAGSATAKPDETFQIDEARRAAVGIKTDKVTRGAMTLELRAVGKLAYDESRLSDVVLKVSGYVSDLRVRTTGQPIRKGDTLFTLYSPDLYAAQQDFLVAISSRDLLGSGNRGEGIVRAAETRLELLGLTAAQIKQIGDKGAPIEKLAFAAPASGYVIEKNVVDGDAIRAGDRLFRIAALDKVWVEADVFEADLGRVAVGQAATIALTNIPDRAFDGVVTFVYPYLDPATRSGRVRIELPNAGLALKPDMYATVTFRVTLPDRIQVPTSAIVYTGPRRLVFVDLGGGKLVAREVTLGARSLDHTEVLAGLHEGDIIVTAGNFLVAAESRIRTTSTYWQDAP